MNKILLLTIQVLFSFSCFAKEKNDTLYRTFDFLSIEEGLSQGSVSSIIQDKEGFMWFATKDGLNRYDGYHIKVYRNDPKNPFSLPDNYITQIFEDASGNFWIGTFSRGICLFDKTHERFYSLAQYNPAEMESYSVRTMTIVQQKLLITTNIDAYAYDFHSLQSGDFQPGNLTRIKLLFHLKDVSTFRYNKINTVSRHEYDWMQDASLWTTYKDSLYIFYADSLSNTWTYHSYPTARLGMVDVTAYRLVELRDPKHLVLLRNGNISILNKKNVSIECSLNTPFIYPSSMNFYKDVKDRIFLPSQKGEICFNPQDLTIKPVKCNLSRDHLSTNAFIDDIGTIWIGSAGHGIYIYRAKKEVFHNPGLGSWYYTRSKQNLIYLNNTDSFITAFDPVQLKKIKSLYYPKRNPASLSPDIWKGLIFGMQFDQDNVLWVLVMDDHSREYLVSYDPNTLVYNIICAPDHPHFQFRKLILDKQNRLWLLKQYTDKKRSLALMDKKNFRMIKEYYFPVTQNIQDYPFISDWWEDSQGALWLGTLEGVFKLNEKENNWQHWKNNPHDSNSLSSNMIFSICPDPRNPEKYLWVGTNGNGLNKLNYRTGSCIHYTEKNGLPNDVIYAIQSDQSGNLWMSTNKGLSCFNEATRQFRNFTKEDGLPGDEFNRYEKLKLPSGELLFGGIEGMTLFNPKEVLSKNQKNHIVLTGLSVYNKPVNHLTDHQILSQPIEYTKRITLPHDQNMFTIEFALLESFAADKRQYAYYLEGLDPGWIPCGNKHEATFTNLSPGSYTFHVKGANSDGVWNEKGTSVEVLILPAWYQTWWFKSLLFLVIGGSIYSLYRYRLAQEKKLYRVRNNIAKDLHDDIGSVLSSISLSTNIIQNKLSNEDSDVQKLISKVSDSSSQMIDSMSDIVWAINVHNDQFDHVIHRMRAFAVEMLEPIGCSIHFSAGPELEKCTLDMVRRKNLYLVYKEAIHNVAKYAQAKNIWITMRLKTDKELELQIKDDGLGFDLNSVMPNDTNYNKGGNGLRNMKERISLIKGRIDIQSEKGNGTEIHITFKL